MKVDDRRAADLHLRCMQLASGAGAIGDLLSDRAEMLEVIRGLLHSAKNNLAGYEFRDRAEALLASAEGAKEGDRAKDVAGSNPAAVSTGTGCDSGDGERGLVPSQVVRREELPTSTKGESKAAAR